MNEHAHTDLTPPVKSAKLPKPPTMGAKEPKAPKEAKPPKVKAEVDPNAPKKVRAPRADYGFASDSTIVVVKDKDNKYRGKRLEWFNSLTSFDGQTVAAWLESKKASEDPPRGWLRFFVQDGTISLTKPVVTEQAAAA